MNYKSAISLLLFVVAIIAEEVHNLFSHTSTTKINFFPLAPESAMSLQWYIHDFGNVISVAVIAYILYSYLKTVSVNMKDIGFIYFIYRLAEIIIFILFNNQFGYSIILTIVGLALYLIVSKWRNN